MQRETVSKQINKRFIDAEMYGDGCCHQGIWLWAVLEKVLQPVQENLAYDT